MIRLRHKLLIHFLRLIDQVVFIVCLAAFGNAYAETYTAREVIAILALLMGSILVFNHFVRYDANRFMKLSQQSESLVKAMITTVFLVAVVQLLFGFPPVSLPGAALIWLVGTGAAIVIRMAIREVLRYLRRSGMTSRQLLIVGCNSRARRLAHTFDSCPELGYRISGFVSEHPAHPLEIGVADNGSRVIGHLGALQSILEQQPADEILICLPFHENFATITDAVRLGEQLGIVVRLMPGDDEDASVLGRMHLELFENEYVVTFFREHLLIQLMIKRLVDISLSLVLLIVLSPILLATAIAIKLTSPGPVLFVQERVGMNRRRFRLYKFRSMVVDADKQKTKLAHLNEMDGPVFKIRNDPRITPVGRFIRKMSIDELPQLFNVLVGSMSMVGPRPPVPSEVEKYEWLFQRRLSIKPGITCLWQVSGRNEVSFREWMDLDRHYVANWSLWLDLKILCRTVPVVLMGRGAS